jgi:nucleotide-binding universal stress UspA family protein
MSTTATHRAVIAAVDGSAASTAAVAWAARDAVTRRVPLTLVHVLPAAPTPRWPDPPVPHDVLREERERHGAQIIDEATTVAKQATLDDPVTVEHRVLPGNALRVLLDLSNDAAVVAVGGHASGAAKRPMWGSIPSGLIRHAHCPVALLDDEVPSTVDPARAPVLLGIAARFEIGAVDIGFAFDEATLRGVGVVALHCCDDHRPHQVPTIERGEHLEEGKAPLTERLIGWERAYPHVALERRLVHGDPVYQLWKASEEAQLVVIGGHGRGGVAARLLGSVSSAVLQALRTPVVIARERTV